MQITKNKVASFDFKVTNAQGEVLDSSEQIGPFEYVHGNGFLIPGLENEMEGKIVGDSFSVAVSPAQAYGEQDEAMIQTLPPDALQGIDVQVGMQLEAGFEGGSRIVTVTKIDESGITLDGNHPLAGLPLNFDVTIVDVRDATPEELEHGHSHAHGGCHDNCGCDDAGCDDTCGGGQCQGGC
ncbi:MAG: peptidylprolyl isomerase [Chloroflexi bacterium]|jgi:FKBP-type peptidyl-prolyl cis-trans isomerase SlyD|nr:peptidylprolyl isomerase [Chloroflexota bacterium]